MEPYKHPATKSKNVGIFILILFGFYGMHRFYIGDKKAGAIILSVSILAMIGIIFQTKFLHYFSIIAVVIILFEILTFFPRLNRYNEKLSKHYL